MTKSHTERNRGLRSGIPSGHAQHTEGIAKRAYSSNAQELSRPEIPENLIPFRQMSRVSGLSSSALAQLEESGHGLSRLASGEGGSKHQSVSRATQSCQHPAVETKSKCGIREARSDVVTLVQCRSQQSLTLFPSLVRGMESLGSNMSIVEGSSDRSLAHLSSTLEPIDQVSEDMLVDDEREERFEENRSEEAIWNEQVIKQVLEEPSVSFQGRILDVFSPRRRERQRLEENEIARALAEKTAETDVVMFQRPHSGSDPLSIGVDVPVVAFDDFEEEQAADFRRMASREQPSCQKSSQREEDRRFYKRSKLDPEHVPKRPSTEDEFRVKHPHAVKELSKKPRDSFLHSLESVPAIRGLLGPDVESETEKDASNSSNPRSWLWPRKVRRPEFFSATEDADVTCEETETPKRTQSNATVGYELFLQEADMVSSPRSRLSRPKPQSEGFLDF